MILNIPTTPYGIINEYTQATSLRKDIELFGSLQNHLLRQVESLKVQLGSNIQTMMAYHQLGLMNFIFK